MWEYRYTDELYHWEKKNHKYIEKKMVNGKWRYTYRDDEGRLAISNRAPSGRSSVENFIDQNVTGKAYIKEANDAYTKSLGLAGYARDHNDKINKAGVNDQEAIAKMKMAQKRYEIGSKRESDKAFEAMDNYYEKSLAGKTKALISNGRNAVASVLEKVSENIKSSELNYKEYDRYKDYLRRAEEKQIRRNKKEVTHHGM